MFYLNFYSSIIFNIDFCSLLIETKNIKQLNMLKNSTKSNYFAEMAEWSKAVHLRCTLFGGVGSKPTLGKLLFKYTHTIYNIIILI